MIETLTWGQIIGASIVVAAVPAGFIIYALCRFSGRLSEEERRERELEAIRQRKTARSNGHFGVETMRRRMRGAADEELGTARSDLAAFAALLLSMALVGAAVWAASGW